MDKLIYIDKDDVTLGPYSKDNVILYLKSGQISSTDLACYVGDVKWSTVAELVGSVGQLEKQTEQISFSQPPPSPPQQSSCSSGDMFQEDVHEPTANQFNSITPQKDNKKSNSGNGALIIFVTVIACIGLFVANEIYNKHYNQPLLLNKKLEKSIIKSTGDIWLDHVRTDEQCYLCEADLSLHCDQSNDKYPDRCLHCLYKPGDTDLQKFKDKKGQGPRKISQQKMAIIQQAIWNAVSNGQDGALAAQLKMAQMGIPVNQESLAIVLNHFTKNYGK